MNFREAIESAFAGKPVRRSHWYSTVRYFVQDGKLLLYGISDSPPATINTAELKATDWELYIDTDYQLIHNWTWAWEQMKAGKQIIKSSTCDTLYYIEDGTMYWLTDRLQLKLHERKCHITSQFIDCTRWALKADQ